MFDTSHINDAIALRRDLHRHPELGFEEHRTSEKIATLLGEWGGECIADWPAPAWWLKWGRARR